MSHMCIVYDFIVYDIHAQAVVRTPMVAAMPAEQVKYMTDKIPMKRTGGTRIPHQSFLSSHRPCDFSLTDVCNDSFMCKVLVDDK